MPIIEVRNVTKVFPARRQVNILLGGGGLGRLFGKRKPTRFAALEDISFDIQSGESVGIIGPNGSGKSTLLKILAGVTVPTSGSATLRGRVASLLELGAGFHPFLTGRENIYLNAGILGMRRAQVKRVMDEIIAFSGLDEFIDNPVNTYSSGMYVRLGFAVAAFANPDIFLVDEVLSVGDEEFQRRCRQRIGELREQGKTIVFVSHDLGIVSALCDRVILLNRGRMVVRNTPRETIEYYLRQVGRESGVHPFADGRVEAILCEGKVSLFYGKKEISVPAGFAVQTLSLQTWHSSLQAEWTIENKTPHGCVAFGQMARLPLRHVWDMRIQDDKLIWRVALECEREANLTSVEINLLWPTRLSHWIYGDVEGVFPQIVPGDMSWTPIIAPDAGCNAAAAFAEQDAAFPCICVRLEPLKPFVRLQWSNTDYVSGARALQIGGRIPEVELPLHRGLHEIAVIEVEMSKTPGRAREQVDKATALRTVRCGDTRMVFRQGAFHLWHGPLEVSRVPHAYASLHTGHLWDDSPNLQWGQTQRSGEKLYVSGESRRFPYRLHVECEPEREGVGLRLWIEALRPFDVQEYQVSIVLPAVYNRWETDHESGEFPDFAPDQNDWRHVNALYTPGTRARALSSGAPSVTLVVTASDVPFRMTVINTDYHLHARVLQALRAPDGGVLHYECGRFLCFEGVIVTGK